MNNDNEIVKLKYDTIFKMFFCNVEHQHSVMCFLARVLDIPVSSIKKIEMRNTEIAPEEVDGKFSRIDVRMTVDERTINVEIQLKREDSFAERTLFYWAKLYTDGFKSGDDYKNLKETVCINIIDFNMFDCPDFHSYFQIMEKDRHEVLNNKLGIHFLELKKLGSVIDKDNPLLLWMRLINSETKEELDMLEKTNVQEIQEAVLIVRKMSEDEKARELSRIREKRLHDEASALGSAMREGEAKGYQKGHDEGEEKGRSDRENEIVENMRSIGMTEEQIKQILNKQ